MENKKFKSAPDLLVKNATYLKGARKQYLLSLLAPYEQSMQFRVDSRSNVNTNDDFAANAPIT